jgi:hypothetical protein
MGWGSGIRKNFPGSNSKKTPAPGSATLISRQIFEANPPHILQCGFGTLPWRRSGSCSSPREVSLQLVFLLTDFCLAL